MTIATMLSVIVIHSKIHTIDVITVLMLATKIVLKIQHFLKNLFQIFSDFSDLPDITDDYIYLSAHALTGLLFYSLYTKVKCMRTMKSEYAYNEMSLPLIEIGFECNNNDIITYKQLYVNKFIVQ